MDRRAFLQSTGVMAAASALSVKSSVLLAAGQEYKMGLQLYTIRDEMAKDPISSLNKVKTMGYQDFELYGFDSGKRDLLWLYV